MFQFLFCYGNKYLRNLEEISNNVWGSSQKFILGDFHLLIPGKNDQRVYCSEFLLGVLSGYVRNDDQKAIVLTTYSTENQHNNEFISRVSHQHEWPLNSGWTGSFAAVVYDDLNKKIRLCNDVLGWLPLYYCQCSHGNWVGGSNLYILGKALDCQIDEVGLIERITPPYVNYGRRTLLSKVSRILPGERLTINADQRTTYSDFDNSLYSEVIDGDVEDIAKDVWGALRKEIQLAVGARSSVGICLSGGWDSRLVLGGIINYGGSITAKTYGNEEYYEVKIAKKCSQVVGASFQSYSIENQYFPTRNALEDLLKRAERVDFATWFPLVSSINPKENQIFLLGDMCEAIAGRNITRFSSRRARTNLSGLFGKRLSFTPMNLISFSNWKNKIEGLILSKMVISRVFVNELRKGIAIDDLECAIKSDLNQDFLRIEENLPFFVEELDELFDWYHKARFLEASQLYTVGLNCEPVVPNQSMRFLRYISKIHPTHRVSRRLMESISHLEEFRELSKIPSAQIPWFGNNFPFAFRNAIWAGRSMLDQIYIKRMMNNHDPNAKQRVLPSLNYVKEYQRASTIQRTTEWFSNEWIMSDSYLGIVENRGTLNAWPLINLDILAPANVSIFLDLLNNN